MSLTLSVRWNTSRLLALSLRIERTWRGGVLAHEDTDSATVCERDLRRPGHGIHIP